MSSLSKKAYDFLVKVKYEPNGDNSEGSAVIIPIDGVDYAYILTAKHTFGIDESQRSDETYHTIDIQNIEIKDIKLSHPQNKFQILEVLNLTYDKYIDLIFFKIKRDEYINKLSSINIYEENFTKALIYGYPIMREEDIVPYQALDGTYRRIDLKDKFELHLDDFPNLAENQDTQDYVAGLSGAGVFVEDAKKEEIYLSGIVVNSSKGNSIKCINILELSKVINSELKKQELKPIPISGAKWKDELGFDITDLDFEEIASDLSSKYTRNEFIKRLDSYRDNKNEFITNFDEKVKVPLNKKVIKLSESSQVYLYLAMRFHLFNENTRATAYFNKAIEYGGDKNRSYLLTAKAKREKKKNEKKRDEQETELILKIIQGLYDEMYEYEEQLKNNPDDESIKKLLKDCYRELREKLSSFDDRDYEINEISKKFMELDFNQNDNIQEQIFELKDMIQMSHEFKAMTNQVNDYQKEIEALNKHIQLLSTHVSDKTLLNKINYRVFNTDKKLDIVSINLSNKIDTSTNKITKKLDEVKITILTTNSRELNSFLENVYRSNQTLVSKIQTMYHQNDRASKQAFIILNNSIKSMNEKIEEYLSISIEVSTDNGNEVVTKIKEIIEISNWNFYKGIQGLCEKKSDSYNCKLLKMSIDFTKKEHELHIEELLKEKNKLEESINELYIDSENNEKTIKGLNKGIEQLKGKTEQIEDLKESINLSSETSKRLEKLEEESKGKLEKYIEQIEEKYKEIDEEKKKFFKEEFYEILKNINSSIDTLSYDPLDKEDFERISKELEDLDSKLDKVSEKVDDLLTFVETIQNNNNSLIGQIQKLYPKDYLTKQQLNMSLDKNREDIQKVIHLPIEEVEQAVETCNNSLYGKIQTLYKDFPKKESLDIDIELTKKDNEKVILLLEKKHQNEIFKIKAKNPKDNYIKWAVVGITFGIVSFGVMWYFALGKVNKQSNKVFPKNEEINSINQEKAKENFISQSSQNNQKFIHDASIIDNNISDTNFSIALIEEDINTTKIVQEKKKSCEVEKIYIVENGDMLGKIAEKCYGKSDEYSKIISENKEIKNKKSILNLGQKIYIPKL